MMRSGFDLLQPRCPTCGAPARPYSSHCSPCLKTLRDKDNKEAASKLLPC